MLILRNQKIILYASIPLMVIFAGFIFNLFSLNQLIAWDEGGYLLQANNINTALKNKGLYGFWETSKAEIYYPFLQSWYYIFMSIFLGFSTNSIRFSNTLLIVPSVILMWGISRHVMPKSIFFQTTPSILLLTSPAIIYYFSTAMKEGLGLVLTLLSFFLYFNARIQGKISLYFFTSISLFILFLTKYNYGVLVIAVIIFETVFNYFGNQRQDRYWTKFTFLITPLFIGLFWWIFYTHPILPVIISVLQNNYQVTKNGTGLFGHLLYYPAEIIFSYSYTLYLGLLLTVGLFASIYKIKDWKIRILWVFFLINLIPAIYHTSNNQARFIFTSIPAFFLLGSFGLKAIISYLIAKSKINMPIFFIVTISIITLLFFFIKDLSGFTSRVRSVGSHQVGSAVFLEKDYQFYDRYTFNTSYWPHQLPSNEEISGQTINDVFTFIFSNTNLAGNFHLLTPLNEFSPGLFQYELSQARTINGIYSFNNQLNYYIVISIIRNSRFDNLDYRRNNEILLTNSKSEVERALFLSQKHFNYLGMDVSIYKDTE